MGEFIKNQLPDPVSYYESQGLSFQERRGKWRTTSCNFHGGTRMRINTETGAFVCMAGCGAKGGDILSYHMAANGLPFAEAAKALGAYREDGRAHPGNMKPTPVPARALLEVAAFELMVCAMVLSDALSGVLSEDDMERFRDAAGRVIYVAEVANV